MSPRPPQPMMPICRLAMLFHSGFDGRILQASFRLSSELARLSFERSTYDQLRLRCHRHRRGPQRSGYRPRTWGKPVTTRCCRGTRRTSHSPFHSCSSLPVGSAHSRGSRPTFRPSSRSGNSAPTGSCRLPCNHRRVIPLVVATVTALAAARFEVLRRPTHFQ